MSTLDAGSLRTHADLLAAIGVRFSFLDYYGQNYNVLNECLRDLSWLPAPGYVLRVHEAESLWRNAPQIAGGLVETWLFCAEYWAALPRPRSFHLLFLW